MPANIQVIKIHLPVINGAYEVGIAAQNDLSLPVAAKLKIDNTVDVAMTATKAAIYAGNAGAAAVNVAQMAGHRCVRDSACRAGWHGSLTTTLTATGFATPRYRKAGHPIQIGSPRRTSGKCSRLS